MYTTFLYPFIQGIWVASMFWFCEYAEMNMIIQAFLGDTDFTLWYIHKSGVGGSSVFFCNFWRICMQFFIMVISVTCPPTEFKVLFFPTYLLALVIFCLLDNSPPNRYEVKYLWFWFAFHKWLTSPFIYLLIIGLSSVKKYLFRFLAHFLIAEFFCCCSWVAIR